jgi:hypothetical protein
VLQAEKDALGIYRHDAIEIVLGLLSERDDLALNARIVAGAIEPAIGAYHAGDQRLDIRGLRHVRSNENSISAPLFYESNSFVSAININV